MGVIEMIGMLAGALTTAAFVPQVVKTWKSRSARDLSLGMFLLFFVGVALWLVYGLYTDSLPIIAANTVTLMLAGVILYFKVRFPN